MSLETHPTRDELAGYVHGTLPEERADTVAEHVETCVACEATVVTLEQQSDSLLDELRRPVAPDPDLESPECQRAIAAAVAIGQSGPDATIALPLMTSYALAKKKPRKLKRLYDRRGAMMDRLKAEFVKANG